MTQGVALGGRLFLPGAQAGIQGRKEHLSDPQAFSGALQAEASARAEGETSLEQEPSGRGLHLADLLEKLTIASDAPANDDENQTQDAVVGGEADKSNLDGSAAEGKIPPLEAMSIADQSAENTVPAGTRINEIAAPAASAEKRPSATIEKEAERPASKAKQITASDAATRAGPEQAAAAKPQQSAMPASAPEPIQPNVRLTASNTSPATQDGSSQEKGFAGQGQENNSKQPFRVVGAQSAPSPAIAPPITSLSPTGASLAGTLSADPGFSTAAAEAARSIATGQTRNPEPLHSLKIQLYPAQLGVVTARLSISEGQLTVELNVETNEARQRLNADGEAMTRALRALGYEVDRVTVQQAQNTANTGGNAGPAERDTGGLSAGGGEGRQGNDASARNGGDEAGRGTERTAREDKDAPARDSLYI